MQTSDKNTDLIELRAQSQQLKQNYKQLNEEQENLLILLQDMEAKTKKYKKQLRKLGQEVSDDELEDDDDEEEEEESENDQAAAPAEIELGHDELTLKNNVLKINTNYSYNEDNEDLYPIQKASLGPIAAAFEQNSSLASSRSENLNNNNNNTSSSSESTNDSLHNHHGHSHDYNYVNPSMITLSPPTGQNFNAIQLNTNQFLYNPAQAPINSFYQPNLDQQSGESPLQSYFK